MSVRGTFGYHNPIPSSPFSIVINCKTLTTNSIRRIMLMNKQDGSSGVSAGPYLAIESDGRQSLVRTKKASNTFSETVTFNTISRLNYVILDFDGTNVRVWKDTPETLNFDLSFSGENYIWFNSGPLVSGSVPSSSIPDIFYIAIYNGLIDVDLKNLIQAGVHPLNIFHRTQDLLFFREYPEGSSADYITSIGSGELIGSSSNSNLYGSNQFDSNYATYNQDRGKRIKLTQGLRLSERVRYIKNDTIDIGHSFIFGLGVSLPKEIEYPWTNKLTFQQNYSLVDKYIHINDSVKFNQIVIVPFERTVDIDNTFFFVETLKSWDGKISNSIKFENSFRQSVSVFNLLTQVLLGNTDIQSNISVEGWTDTCLFVENFGTDYDNQVADTNKHEMQIVEQITMIKDITRAVENNVTFTVECRAYKITPARLENFGG